MKGAVLCQQGLEDLASAEIKELIGVKGKLGKGYVTFSIKKIEDLFLLCYKAQLVSKVLLVLDEFKAVSVIDIVKKVTGLKIPDLIENQKTFAVRAQTDGDGDREIEEQVGAVICQGLKVDLEQPDVIVYVQSMGGDCLIGVDFSGEDLSKRDYKIYQTRQGLKATTCKALVDLSGYERGKVLVNPFSAEGIMGIEAVCKVSGKSIHFYHKDKFQFRKMFEKEWEDLFDAYDTGITKEKCKVTAYDEIFKHVDYGKKNAKIAGVQKLLTFSRLAVEWLDTKFDKESVDCIVTYPPQESRFVAATKVLPAQRELFYQAKFVLKSNGKLVVLMRGKGKLAKFAEDQEFTLVESREIKQGKNSFYIEVFKK